MGGGAYVEYITNISSLAPKTRVREDPEARETLGFARHERFIRREGRIFLRLASAPHAPLVQP